MNGFPRNAITFIVSWHTARNVCVFFRYVYFPTAARRNKIKSAVLDTQHTTTTTSTPILNNNCGRHVRQCENIKRQTCFSVHHIRLWRCFSYNLQFITGPIVCVSEYVSCTNKTRLLTFYGYGLNHIHTIVRVAKCVAHSHVLWVFSRRWLMCLRFVWGRFCECVKSNALRFRGCKWLSSRDSLAA